MPSSLLTENRRPNSSDGDSSPPSPRLHHHQRRKTLHPLADESEDGYSTHPSIYSASPVGSSGGSDCGGDGISESKEKEKQRSSSTATAIFEQDVEDPEPPPTTARRTYTSFSGLSVLDTISEQKSVDSRSVLAAEEEDDTDDGEDELLDGYSTDDELEYEYGRSFYCEYASPTQPLHPSRSRSAPPRESNPLLQHSPQSSSVPVEHTFFSRSPTRFDISHNPSVVPRPAFRPVQSMNRSYGSLMAHPFHRAPTARFLDNPITPDELDSPGMSRADLPEREGVWGRLLRGFCLVCCCFVLDEPGRR